MKNRGFTLAEVIITIAILGVVASLTMPALMTNFQKQQVGPALAKAINTLENNNKIMMFEKNLPRLTIDSDYIKTMMEYTGGSIEEQEEQYYHPQNGSVGAYSGAKTILTTKDGIKYTYSTTFMENSIFIDINGAKGPGKLGIDLFVLYIDSKGRVAPYGGKEYAKLYAQKNNKEPGDPIWETECNKETRSDGLACAGSVVDNGYKVIYPFN